MRQQFGDAGIRVVLTPARARTRMRTLNGSFRAIKEECLDRMIPLGERHFRRAVAEFVAHYHCERNHQGLDNELIAGTRARDAAGPISTFATGRTA